MSFGRLFSDAPGVHSGTGRVRTRAKKTLLICSTPRSGSNLLAEALASTRLCGLPLEYFNHEYEDEFREQWQLSSTVSVRDYLAEAIGRTTTPNGVFGLKIHWHQLSRLLQRVFPGRPSTESVHEMSSLFPRIHYISLTRRDKLRQAISYSRALQTNIWWRVDGVRDPKERRVQPRYHRGQIAALLERIESYEAAWEHFYSQLGVEPARLIYEDFDACGAAALAMTLLGHSSEVGELSEPRLQRQADELSDEWVAKFERSIEERNG